MSFFICCAFFSLLETGVGVSVLTPRVDVLIYSATRRREHRKGRNERREGQGGASFVLSFEASKLVELSRGCDFLATLSKVLSPTAVLDSWLSAFFGLFFLFSLFS